MDARQTILIQPHAVVRLRERDHRFAGRSDESCRRLLRWMLRRAVPFGGVKPPKFRRLFVPYDLVIAGTRHYGDWTVRTILTREMAETTHEIKRGRPRRGGKQRRGHWRKR